MFEIAIFTDAMASKFFLSSIVISFLIYRNVSDTFIKLNKISS